MNGFRFGVLAVGLFGLYSTTSFRTPDQAGNDIVIDGSVQDSSGKAIPGVKVAVWIIGRNVPVDSVRTDEQGYFKFMAKAGSTFDIVYTHTRLEPCCIPWLVENKKQHINKVLYARGEKRPVGSYHEALVSTERMMLIAAAVPRQERKAIVNEFTEGNIGAIMTVSFQQTGIEFPGDTRLLLEGRQTNLKNAYKEIGFMFAK